MNKQDRRAVRLQASIIRGQIECLTSAAKHSPTEYERIMSSVRVLESVARVIDVFVSDEAKAASQPLPEGVPCLSPLSGHQDGCACRECTD